MGNFRFKERLVEIFLIVLYGITALFWGVFAVLRKEERHFNKISDFGYVLVFFINLLFMPICLFIAIVTFDKTL